MQVLVDPDITSYHEPRERSTWVELLGTMARAKTNGDVFGRLRLTMGTALVETR